jgi:hypothetical protein
MKSRRMRELLALMGEKVNAYNNYLLRDFGLDGSIIVK